MSASTSATAVALQIPEINIQFQQNWLEVLQSNFMQNALWAGTFLAISGGLLGFYVILRNNTFAAHAIAHIGFPGATAAALFGAPVSLGLLLFCLGGGLAIGFLGKKAAEREIVTGTVLAFATALGVLFGALASKNLSTVTNVLFGNLLAISDSDLVVFIVLSVLVVLALAVISRPLQFASIDPTVAEAKGVPVKTLDIAFMVLMAFVTTMAVQVVGTLLLFALVITPTAAAIRLSARPFTIMLLGGGFALASVWGGLLLASMFNIPPSFFIVSIAVSIWAIANAATVIGRRDVARSGGNV